MPPPHLRELNKPPGRQLEHLRYFSIPDGTQSFWHPLKQHFLSCLQWESCLHIVPRRSQIPFWPFHGLGHLPGFTAGNKITTPWIRRLNVIIFNTALQGRRLLYPMLVFLVMSSLLHFLPFWSDLIDITKIFIFYRKSLSQRPSTSYLEDYRPQSFHEQLCQESLRHLLSHTSSIAHDTVYLHIVHLGHNLVQKYLTMDDLAITC